MQYKIIQGGAPIELEPRVREAIKEGWQPLGGPIFAQPIIQNKKKMNLMMQAMVKYN